MRSKLTLIIPAYNEEKRLPAFLTSLEEYVGRHPNQIDEIIVVDDGSTDATVRIAREYAVRIPSVKVVLHENNRGKGAAVQTGVMMASGDLVVFIDADGATPIDELPSMLSALSSFDIAVGNRWMRGAKTARHSYLRRFSGWVNRMYMSLFGLGSVDTMCGFKGYRAAVAKDLFSTLREERWLFDTEIAYKARMRGYRVKNFPIRWESKDGSKLDTLTLITSGLSILPLIIRIKRG